MSKTSAKPKNAKWGADEVFQILAQHTSSAWDGGNFPTSKYKEAASHIAQYQGPALVAMWKLETKWRHIINW